MAVSNDKAQKSPVRKSKEKGISPKTMWSVAHPYRVASFMPHCSPLLPNLRIL
jgi:hypothetical protein